MPPSLICRIVRRCGERTKRRAAHQISLGACLQEGLKRARVSRSGMDSLCTLVSPFSRGSVAADPAESRIRFGMRLATACSYAQEIAKQG